MMQNGMHVAATCLMRTMVGKSKEPRELALEEGKRIEGYLLGPERFKHVCRFVGQSGTRKDTSKNHSKYLCQNGSFAFG